MRKQQKPMNTAKTMQGAQRSQTDFCAERASFMRSDIRDAWRTVESAEFGLFVAAHQADDNALQAHAVALVAQRRHRAVGRHQCCVFAFGLKTFHSRLGAIDQRDNGLPRLCGGAAFHDNRVWMRKART